MEVAPGVDGFRRPSKMGHAVFLKDIGLASIKDPTAEHDTSLWVGGDVSVAVRAFFLCMRSSCMIM